MEFSIDKSIVVELENKVKFVNLDGLTERDAVEAATLNCGCGGTCLSSTT